jgi:hypothetical protein
VLFFLSENTNLVQFNAVQKIVQINGSVQNGNDVEPVYVSSFSKFTVSEPALRTIDALPPLLAPYGKYQVASTADVLYKQKIGNVTTDNPLVLFNETNGKKTAVLCAEGWWRWRLNEFQQNRNFNATDELINKCIQYLTVKSDKRKFRVRSTKNIYNANESIQLDAELYNETYQLVNDVDANCVIKGDNGKEYPFTFDKTVNAYTLNAGVLPVGNYTVSARASYKGQMQTAVCNFSVRQVIVEMLNTQANHQLLRTLALQSGGAFYDPGNMNRIADDLEKNSKVHSILYDTFTTRPLIDLKWLFALILLLLTAEWFIRKFNGSI